MNVQRGLRTTKIQKEDYSKKVAKRQKLSGSEPKVSSLRPEELKGRPA